MNQHPDPALVEWFVSGERGLSSEAIANKAHYGHIANQRLYPFPHDPADLRRCVQLIEAAPIAATALTILAERSIYWKHLVDNWKRLTESLKQEMATNSNEPQRAPQTYELMKQVIEKAQQETDLSAQQQTPHQNLDNP